MNYKARQRIDAVLSGESDTLDLSNLGLTELPEEVYTLTSLKKLEVANYLLFSNQPLIDLLSELPTLREEDIQLLKETEEAEQELRDDLLVPKQLKAIDPKISQLKALEVLDLRFNAIGWLPDTIGQLPNLRQLLLMQNKLTALPDSLDQLSSLELLDVQDNPVTSVPILPQFKKYTIYRNHFRQQVRDAFRAKDVDMGIWLYQKQSAYGLLS